MASIRLATREDSGELAAIYHQCRQEATWLPESSRLQSNFEQDTDGEVVFVSTSDLGAISGFISVWMPESFIHHLYVHPAMKRQGVGSALLAHLEGHVGFPWTLKCSQANTQAKCFYLHRGWRTIDTVGSGDEPYFLLEFDPRIES